MRKKLIAGNWKMNGSLAANEALLQGLRGRAEERRPATSPSACRRPTWRSARPAGRQRRWRLGAQDVSQHEAGAYTGEISVAMLKDFGVRYAIVGHSERRQYHGETDAVVAAKAQRALAGGVTPIVCVGETLAEREAGKTEEVVKRQLAAVIHLNGHCISEIVVAYEPVWAIGTGKTASAGAGAAGARRAARTAEGRHAAGGSHPAALRRQHECRQCRAVAGPERHRRRPDRRCLAQGPGFSDHHFCSRLKQAVRLLRI